MLNSTTINNHHESKVVAVTKEIEKTISPDKVTEMYDAVREEVENNIVLKLRFETNTLKGVGVILNENLNTDEKRYVASYNLNGKDYITKGYLPAFEATEAVLIDKLYEHYQKEIAREFVKESTKVIFRYRK